MWWVLASALATTSMAMELGSVEDSRSAWTQIKEGPRGCWEVVGRAAWDWDGDRFGARKGSAAFIGRLEDGIWKDILVRSQGEDRRLPFGEGYSDLELRQFPADPLTFTPLVGQAEIPADDDKFLLQQSMRHAFVREVNQRVGDGDVTMNRGADGTIVVETSDLTHHGEATAAVWIDTDSGVPTRAELSFPRRIRLPSDRPITVRDAFAEIRATNIDGVAFPAAEIFHLKRGFWGQNVQGSQTVEYLSYRPCQNGDTNE